MPPNPTQRAFNISGQGNKNNQIMKCVVVRTVAYAAMTCNRALNGTSWALEHKLNVGLCPPFSLRLLQSAGTRVSLLPQKCMARCKIQHGNGNRYTRTPSRASDFDSMCINSRPFMQLFTLSSWEGEEGAEQLKWNWAKPRSPWDTFIFIMFRADVEACLPKGIQKYSV